MSNFKGFEKPTENYSKLPHSFIDQLPEIDTMAEMKVVLYLLRHTWGFSEFGKPKKLTTDEFANGRKKRDQSRMDSGTGLSENSVRAGLDKAVEHGFILVETDESDKARIEKWYCLNMESDSEIESRPAKIAPLGAEFAERSEKETIERKEQIPDIFPLEWYIQHNQPVPASLINKNQLSQNAINEFEGKLGFSSLPWDSSKDWEKFKAWVIKTYSERLTAWEDYADWRKAKGKYDAMNNKQIRMNPKAFMDTGYPSFLAHVSMYDDGEKTRLL